MDLARFAGMVRHSFRLIVLITVAVAASTFLVSELLPRAYESEARVLVGSLTDPNSDKLSAYQQLAQTYAALASTNPVLSRVAAQLGLTDDPARLAPVISVRASVGQSIVRIVATASSPTGAQQLANAVAAQLLELGRPSKTEASLVSIIQPAVLPEGPSSPRVILNTVMATAVGFALSIGLAMQFENRREAEVRP